MSYFSTKTSKMYVVAPTNINFTDIGEIRDFLHKWNNVYSARKKKRIESESRRSLNIIKNYIDKDEKIHPQILWGLAVARKKTAERIRKAKGL